MNLLVYDFQQLNLEFTSFSKVGIDLPPSLELLLRISMFVEACQHAYASFLGHSEPDVAVSANSQLMQKCERLSVRMRILFKGILIHILRLRRLENAPVHRLRDRRQGYFDAGWAWLILVLNEARAVPRPPASRREPRLPVEAGESGESRACTGARPG